MGIRLSEVKRSVIVQEETSAGNLHKKREFAKCTIECWTRIREEVVNIHLVERARLGDFTPSGYHVLHPRCERKTMARIYKTVLSGELPI